MKPRSAAGLFLWDVIEQSMMRLQANVQRSRTMGAVKPPLTRGRDAKTLGNAASTPLNSHFTIQIAKPAMRTLIFKTMRIIVITSFTAGALFSGLATFQRLNNDAPTDAGQQPTAPSRQPQ
ncbi:MAG: hypothetical protein ACKO0M_06845 [Cyanobium sp.]